MPHLQSSWDLHHQSGEPHTIIRVANLQTVLPIGRDAWGRSSKPQPVLISSSISLSHPFVSASSTDTVTKATVHYGILSKALLAACQEFKDICTDEVMPVPMHLRALVHFVCWFLTGNDVMPKVDGGYVGGDAGGREEEPVLKGVLVRSLEIVVRLPKASLLGSGVSLKGAFSYEEGVGGVSAYSMVLKLHDLRVPAVIGVNANERLAKQMVVCNLEMDRYDRMIDCYCELEEIVVKTIEESSFQTLEALASHIGERIVTYFLIPDCIRRRQVENIEHLLNYQKIRICLEKPAAVMFADAPAVEMLLDSHPQKSESMAMLWKEKENVKKPPFPLQGRLDEWIKENGTTKMS